MGSRAGFEGGRCWPGSEYDIHFDGGVESLKTAPENLGTGMAVAVASQMAADDHGAESSTVPHQSEFALLDAMMPILHPAGLQELFDYGIYGFALSRYSGCWVGIKCVSFHYCTAKRDNIDKRQPSGQKTFDGRFVGPVEHGPGRTTLPSRLQAEFERREPL